MRLLVTGAQGFLGEQIVKQLQLGGSEVIATGRRTAAGVYSCDLTDPVEVQAMITAVRPDRIIHCAAHVPQSQAEYRNSNRANESLRMLENLLACSCCPLVFMSSMTVYGTAQGHPLPEEAAGEPQSAYGQGKWQAEQLLRMRDCPALAVRIPGLFGPARRSGLIFNVLHALKHGEALPKLPDSPVLWAAMHVNDAAAGVIKLAHAPIDDHQAINLGYRGKFAIDEFLTLTAGMFGQTVAYALKHPQFECDLSRANALGVVSNKTFRDALMSFSEEI